MRLILARSINFTLLGTAVWLAGDLGTPIFVILACTSLITGVASWITSGGLLRGLRLLNGAITATMATLTTVALSLTVSAQSQAEDPGFTMLVVLLAGVAFSTWVCDWRIKSADDVRAATRHAELLAVVQASQASEAETVLPTLEVRRSPAVAFLTLAAFVLLWRRGR